MKSLLLPAILLAVAATGCTTHGGAAVGLANTHWHLETINGHDVISHSKASLIVSPEGRVSGSGSCNAMFGHATVSGTDIAFGSMGSTMMACNPAEVNAQEHEYNAALRQVAHWRIKDGRLHLIDRAGTDLLVFEEE